MPTHDKNKFRRDPSLSDTKGTSMAHPSDRGSLEGALASLGRRCAQTWLLSSVAWNVACDCNEAEATEERTARCARVCARVRVRVNQLCYLRASPSCATAVASDLCRRAISASYMASSAFVTQSSKCAVTSHPGTCLVSTWPLRWSCTRAGAFIHQTAQEVQPQSAQQAVTACKKTLQKNDRYKKFEKLTMATSSRSASSNEVRMTCQAYGKDLIVTVSDALSLKFFRLTDNDLYWYTVL